MNDLTQREIEITGLVAELKNAPSMMRLALMAEYIRTHGLNREAAIVAAWNTRNAVLCAAYQVQS